VVRRRVACGVWCLLVLLMVAGSAAAGLSQASKANRSEARGDAGKQLAGVSLPPGAAALQSQRATVLLEHSSFDCRVGAFGGFTPYLNVIRERRYWQVPQDPASVRAWVREHAPSGSTLVDSGSNPTRSGGTIWYLTFDFSPDKGRVAQRCLDVVIKGRANGEGSAVGAESQATWRLTRPSWDYVPSHAGVITVTRTVKERSKQVTLRDPRRVAQFVQGLNRAHVFQPVLVHCPKGRPESWKLMFRDRQASHVLAQATLREEACPSLNLRVGGRRGPLLDITQQLRSAFHSLAAHRFENHHK
jgi:hypothetical protein